MRSAGAAEAELWAHSYIDFETLGFHQELTIKATDVQYPSLAVQKTFTINIYDVIETDVTLENGE